MELFLNNGCAFAWCSCLPTPFGVTIVGKSVWLLHVRFRKYEVESTIICVLCMSICIGVDHICTCDATSDLCKYSFRVRKLITKLLLDI